jgi:hypothetical protein
MASRVAFLLSVALVASACVANTAPSTSVVEGSTTTTSEPALEVREPTGELVILDGSGDIVVTRPDGTSQRKLTTGAGETAAYFQPIWSPDSSRIAWGQVDEDGFAVAFQLVGDDEPTTVPMVNLPFYMNWAPDGMRIGSLRNGAAGIEFELVDVSTGTSSVLDTGAPFYFSWSPTADRMITHVGTERFEILTTDGNRANAGTTSADYLAPQWTISGIFHVDEMALTIETLEETREQIVGVTGVTAFVANDQGTRVALQSLSASTAVSLAQGELETVPTNQVVVVDVGSGEVEVVSTEPVLGFFWSPDGESLLVFGGLSSGDSGAFVWTVGRGVEEYASFLLPDGLVQRMFAFFPQYAQSMSFWSPESTAFAYSAVEGEMSAIWVQRLGSGSPERISDGNWVSWSR